jgi:hypothetical protein
MRSAALVVLGPFCGVAAASASRDGGESAQVADARAQRAMAEGAV